MLAPPPRRTRRTACAARPTLGAGRLARAAERGHHAGPHGLLLQDCAHQLHGQRPAGGWAGWVHGACVKQALGAPLCAAAHVPAHLPPTPPHTHTHLQNKDLALPQHSDRAHKLLADNDTTVHMSYDVRAGAGMGAGGVVLVGSMGGHSRPAGLLLMCTCCYSTCRCTEHWQQRQQRRRDSPVYCRTL